MSNKKGKCLRETIIIVVRDFSDALIRVILNGLDPIETVERPTPRLGDI